MNAKVESALSEQINEELASAYVYLAMSAHMDSEGYKGFAHWLRMQWEEELVHALKFYDFVLQRGAKVTLKALDTPSFEHGTPLEMFKTVLAHEQHITATIHRLYEIAEAEKDYALKPLLHWFIDEQTEEEDSVREIIDKLELVGDSRSNLYLIDQELGARAPESEESEDN